MTKKTITILKEEYLQMKSEIKAFRNSNLYKKILRSKEELKTKIYTRDDLGF